MFFCIVHLRFLYNVVVFCKSSFSYPLSFGCDGYLIATCLIVLAIWGFYTLSWCSTRVHCTTWFGCNFMIQREVVVNFIKSMRRSVFLFSFYGKFWKVSSRRSVDVMAYSSISVNLEGIVFLILARSVGSYYNYIIMHKCSISLVMIIGECWNM